MINISPKDKRNIAFSLFAYWIFMVIFLILDLLGTFGSDIGTTASLQTSSLARVMFVDIGGLSMFAASWIYFSSKAKVRYVLALLSLFVGGFAALPYIAYQLWKSSNVDLQT